MVPWLKVSLGASFTGIIGVFRISLECNLAGADGAFDKEAKDGQAKVVFVQDLFLFGIKLFPAIDCSTHKCRCGVVKDKGERKR